jgi:hypothetical protein
MSNEAAPGNILSMYLSKLCLDPAFTKKSKKSQSDRKKNLGYFSLLDSK